MDINDLVNVPITLSIALKNNEAKGHVYLEEGSDLVGKTEYHEVVVRERMI